MRRIGILSLYFMLLTSAAPSYSGEVSKFTDAEGFLEINLQVFTDADGARKYQTCWIKYGK